MTDEQPLGCDHVALQIGRHDAGRTRGNNDVGRSGTANVGQNALLEFDLFGDILLDEVGLGRHFVQVSRECKPAFRRQRRKCQARECGLSVSHSATYPGFHLRLHIGSNDVNAVVQGARGPAATDDAGAQ